MSWKHERAKVAALSRCVAAGERSADDPELKEARRNLRALRLEDHVTQVLSGAPPLTDEQRERIAGLLRVGYRNDRQTVVQARITELDGGGNDAA